MRTTPWLLFACVFFANSGVRADDYVVSAEHRRHWAWQPVSPQPLPQVRHPDWCLTPIDRFILARLDAAGLQPARAASQEQLIRRVTFDLIGLPPTPLEIADFVHDPSPLAWEKVIDRLLASPHYGERWGRHWLDLARFAESNGYEFDETRPDAWRFRDYVIESLNQDKPFDRFISEQLAGDELSPDDPRALIATGFNLLGPDMTDSSDQLQRRHNTLNDMTDTTALVFLGLTMGCARCHDHKFEPIPQTDYFRLQAFFTPAQFRRDLPVASGEQLAALRAALAAYRERVAPIEQEIAKLEGPQRHKLREAKLAKLSEDVQIAHRTPAEQRTDIQQIIVEETSRQLNVSLADVLKLLSDADKGRHRQLQEQLKKLESKKPPMPVAMGLQNGSGPPPKTFVLERGEPRNRGDEVHPGYPLVLTNFVEQALQPAGLPHGRRAALANWIASDANPLTARVIVNRLWQHHFGRGIVPSANDFGVRGEPPTHPELLDWLASEFIVPHPFPLSPGGRGERGEGWRLKHMHRLMLLSATYRQTSQASADTLQKDPENLLFSRMNRLRLEGEIIRDSLLAISGRLNRQMGGASVFPPIPAEALQGAKGWTTSASKSNHVRRSVYIFARRNLRFPFLEAFDLPDSNLSCPKRERSTTAPQALALLNADDVVDAARTLADRLKREASSRDEQIALAHQLILGRHPTPIEISLAADFLNESPLSELCRALFNVNEFLYCD